MCTQRTWHSPVQPLCMLLQSLWVYINFDHVDLEGRVFLGVLHPFWLKHSFCFHRMPWALTEKDLMELFYSGLGVSWSLTLCVVHGCGWTCIPLCMSPSVTEGSFSDGDWTRLWSTSTAEYHQQSYYHFFFFYF